MAELRPYPFADLITRMFREFREQRSIFDLPERKFVRGDPALDLSVTFHGHKPATALGPAAGPHSQMAQNIVLAWLAGCRVIELKTVQILDRIYIAQSCHINDRVIPQRIFCIAECMLRGPANAAKQSLRNGANPF